MAFHETHVKPHIQTILRNHNVAYRFIGLGRRRNPGLLDPPDDLETPLIDTPRRNPTAWKVAVMEWANLYYGGGYGPNDIEVEI